MGLQVGTYSSSSALSLLLIITLNIVLFLYFLLFTEILSFSFVYEELILLKHFTQNPRHIHVLPILYNVIT